MNISKMNGLVIIKKVFMNKEEILNLNNNLKIKSKNEENNSI